MWYKLMKSVRPIRNSIISARAWVTSNVTENSDGNAQDRMNILLRRTFPKATCVSVVDVSGGCGAMFEVSVEAPDFNGLTTVKQHRLVTDALKEEITQMHGIRIFTTVSKVFKEK